MTAVTPLAIDGMLPAFPNIAAEFGVNSPDKIQLIIAILFLGFGIGQLVFGPLSDAIGRKSPIYWGLGTFAIGSVISGFANSYELFLFGRFLQGFGGAAPRIVSLAVVRDQFSGNAMAQIVSMVMTIFILVPAVAPSLGQGVLMLFDWRAIFILLFAMAALVWIWFGVRIEETLPVSSRKPFTFGQLWVGTQITFSKFTTVACMLISGLVYGLLVGYLGAIQNLFSTLFNVTTRFPAFFAILSLSIGVASFYNSRLVMKLGMRRLVWYAFSSMTFNSVIFAAYLVFFQTGTPPLWGFMLYLSLTFSSIGFLFGNLNALAMAPLGEIAGLGSALIGCTQSVVGVFVGIFLGQFFHNSVLPLVLSFGGVSLLCILIFLLDGFWQRAK